MGVRLGSASWSFILCALLLFLIAEDSGARKIAVTSGRDIQLKEVSYDLQNIAAVGHILSNIIQFEGAGVEIKDKHVRKDDDEEDEDEDEDEEHKKNKGKYGHKDDDDEDEDEEQKKNKGKHVHKDDEDDDDDDEEDEDEEHKKNKGKYVHKDDDDEEHKKNKGKYVHKDDDDEEHKKNKGKYVHKDDDDEEHKKNKGKYVHKDDDDEEHKKNKGKDVHKDEDDENDKHKKMKGKGMRAYKSTHMDHNHMNPELNVFFIPSDMKIGKKLPIYFTQKDPSTSPKFLPREEADQIPFSSKQLPSLLRFFSFSKHSDQAKAMKYTLQQCEFESMKGETKFCATSLETLLDFAHHIFGSTAQFKVLATTHLKNSSVLLQNYTISEVKEISAPKVIGCHPLPYPYAVFYCHSQEGDTSLFEVLVEGENGGIVQAAAICHMDTSQWDPDHVAFSVLKVEPGTSPVCHFFPPDNLVLVPLPSAH